MAESAHYCVKVNVPWFTYSTTKVCSQHRIQKLWCIKSCSSPTTYHFKQSAKTRWWLILFLMWCSDSSLVIKDTLSLRPLVHTKLRSRIKIRMKIRYALFDIPCIFCSSSMHTALYSAPSHSSPDISCHINNLIHAKNLHTWGYENINHETMYICVLSEILSHCLYCGS